jgi:hypothetical protein
MFIRTYFKCGDVVLRPDNVVDRVVGFSENGRKLILHSKRDYWWRQPHLLTKIKPIKQPKPTAPREISDLVAAWTRDHIRENNVTFTTSTFSYDVSTASS